MPYYTKSQIEQANQTDLVAFLLSRGENVKRIGSQYLWEKHQVWINKNKWYTHYESNGGYPIKFVMKYFGLGFQDAVKELLGENANQCIASTTQKRKAKELILPEANPTMNSIYAYLMNKRFIARDVITHFVRAKMLYEDIKFHNCVFVGFDENGVPKHCHRRSTNSSFKMTESGSQAEYSFHHIGESEWLFVFEAPVDMLAFITLHQKEWQRHSYVALCSVSEKAILYQLKQHSNLKKIVLCLDNDNAGIYACNRIKDILQSLGYTNVRMLHSVNKDWDEDVKAINGISPIPAEADETKEIHKLCHTEINEICNKNQPPMLYSKMCDTYTSVVNANQYNRKEQTENLLGLLLYLAKDECRKTLDPIEWSDIELKLKKLYIPHSDNGDITTRLRQLDRHIKVVFDIYNTPNLVYDSSIFLNPILQVCMDCIRLIHYLERKENAQCHK